MTAIFLQYVFQILCLLSNNTWRSTYMFLYMQATPLSLQWMKNFNLECKAATVYCLRILFVVKKFCCFTSLPSFPKPAFIVYMCKNLQSNFCGSKGITKNTKLFCKHYMVFWVARITINKHVYCECKSLMVQLHWGCWTLEQ